MDEDSSASNTDSNNPDKVSEQVFDISPDLNIRPITNDAPEDVPAEISDPVLKATAENLENMARLNVTPAPIILDSYGPIAGKSTSAQASATRSQPPVPTPIAISTTPQNTPTKDMPATPKEPVPPMSQPPKPAPTPPPVNMPAQAPVASNIPLQDFSASLSKTKTAPANPPAKTIGALRQNKFDEADSRHDLQSAISSIVPAGDTKGPLAGKIFSDDRKGPRNIRTYEGDIADVMSHKRTSVASIAIAENKKNEGKAEEVISNSTDKEPSHAVRNILLTLASLMLIGGGAYGAYYLYKISPLYQMIGSTAEPPVQQDQKVPSLIPADSQKVLMVDNLSEQAMISEIRSEISSSQSADSIKEIILAKTDSGKVVRVSSTDMVSLLDLGAPDILTRSLVPDWMLGIYDDSDGQKNTFIVATNDFFQNTFAGMLQWESTMPNDLRPYLLATATLPSFKVSPDTVANASSTATDTAAFVPVSVPMNGKFVDRIIKNKDVREYVTSDGHVLFLYSFIDDSKLIITGNENTLSEILARLEKQAFVR